MARSMLPEASCPICSAHVDGLLELHLAERRWLSSTIAVASCAACDFAFVCPADAENYANYYAETTNDLLSVTNPSETEQSRFDTQAGFLSPLLSEAAPKRVLDIGCGSGGLLRTLQQAFPQHGYHGVDPNVGPGAEHHGVSFSRKLDDSMQSFDLVILSHTLEHVVDLAAFSSVLKLLAADGSLYVEVPDASRYADFPRREYLYYFDRLHINHFSTASLEKLLADWGLVLNWTSFHDFQYKDDQLYPAFAILASRQAPAVPLQLELKEPLGAALERYRQGERDRARDWQTRLAEFPQILVYGFGDNFFRARAAGGPLSEQNILAVIDRRWRDLSESRYAADYSFMDQHQAAEQHSQIPVVVAVSWQAETIAETLSEAGFSQVFIL
ncbi:MULTISPECIES: class I SAM-dependent methyltransferase [Pseudomonas]|uniref:class I SAM-dependent methyltransferase n=1 Tax=Pseudomonas TaxID=286 RepID=UPI002DBEE2BF|nr:class I SAM-dependent methyltransferase [Pseudomonas asiatica]MEB6589957.1 class I SAM-dependent methyltransferase [Pseudomonas asiatica]